MAMTWSKAQIRTTQDIATFDALILQHWNPICETLFRLTGDWQEAEDLALETFIRLYQRPPAQAQNLGGWLYRVATRLGLNALRARQRRQFYEQRAAREPSSNPTEYSLLDPALAVEQEQERQIVRCVLAGMNERSATLLLLRSAGLSYVELATAVGVAPGSVGALLTRAQKEFAKKYRQISDQKEA